MTDARRAPRAFAAGLLLLAGLLAITAAAADYDGYRVKAAFLLNFARLVEWPSAAEPGPGESLVVGLHGDEEVAARISGALEGAKVNGHAVSVHTLASPAESAGCHIVFVATQDIDEAIAWVDATQGQATLTVGESVGFAGRGGVINFFVENGKLRFEINKHAADRKGLRISSRLLRLARLVADTR